MLASTDMAARRFVGASSTRKALQVPKNAPVANPWRARATRIAHSGGWVASRICAAAITTSAVRSTPRLPMRSESCPIVSIDGTSAATYATRKRVTTVSLKPSSAL